MSPPRRSSGVAVATAPDPSPPSPAATATRTALQGGRLASVTMLIAALLFLNGIVSFDNWWPTPAVKPAATLSLECLALLAILCASAALGPVMRRRVVTAAALAYTALAVGRYAAVTAPALFGRPVNLYWDGPHLPGLLMLAWTQLPAWQAFALAAACGTLVWAVYRLIRAAAGRVADRFAAASTRIRSAAAGTIVIALAAGTLLLLSPPPRAGHEHEVFWRHRIADPVSAGWASQVGFVVTALSPARVDALLPPGPAFTGNLAALAGADVLLLFLESYGATAFDLPAFREALAPRRRALATTLAERGQHVVSAFVTSPTFGGGSWLAHASLLSGLDLDDPGRYDLLMTTDRPTLVSHFRRHGYHATALMPGLRSDWSEAAFYRFDKLMDSRTIDYAGPDFGFWRIPDQVALHRYDAYRRSELANRPALVVFPTINSHLPFDPLPPYQADWARLSTDEPFDTEDVLDALARKTDWLKLGPAYVDALDYTFRWIDGFLKRPGTRDALMILIGDHQPAASVTGRGASWDVPVHIVTASAEIAAKLVAAGFREGLEPVRPVLGRMGELTDVLARAFDREFGRGSERESGREVRPGPTRN